jgi:CubicO group peptidase (beta-lactamase class C family)
MKIKINNLIMYILITVIGTLELEEYIDDFADKHIGVETAGTAVSILQDGDIVFYKNYGYAVSRTGQARP